jgi:hypothetical protein
MSKAIFDDFQGPNNSPANFPFGFKTGTAGSNINNIGIAGGQGFGVGICPGPLPAGMAKLQGTDDPASDNYGNYLYSDGSVMVWVPAFFYKYGTGANGLAINAVSIKSFADYATIATANAAGYALHRAFYDGGAVQPGVFVDKFLCSNNGGVASSIKKGIVLSSAQRGTLTTAMFSALNGAPSNAHHGALLAARTRGANFFCNTRFIFSALALLSYAHAQASTNTTFCGWYHATYNFPKGNNNNALGDTNDAAILYVNDGNGTYNCGKTGSANFFSRTTHNGQNCGVADQNGLVYEINPGLTSNGVNIYVLKTSAQAKALTNGNTLATDLWGAVGIAALYDDLGTTYGPLWATGANRTTYFGSANQVFSEATDGLPWNTAGCGIPLANGVGGTNPFGSDFLYDYKPNDMCPISGGTWNAGSNAGVWAFTLTYVRGDSSNAVGFRSALYL